MSTPGSRTEFEDMRRQRDDAQTELVATYENLASVKVDRESLGLAIARLTRAHEDERAALTARVRGLEHGSALECTARWDAEAERDKALGELATIERRAGGAVGALKPDGTTVEIAGPLDAVATLEVYARNLKTRLAHAEAEALHLREEHGAACSRIASLECSLREAKAAWEELARAQLQAQERKARKARR